MTDREIRQWATRVVDLYASRVSLTLLQQGELERATAAEFKKADESGVPLADWVPFANAALDEWERTHSHRGTRVAMISVSSRQVIEKKRSG